jgi:hypothetical protein
LAGRRFGFPARRFDIHDDDLIQRSSVHVKVIWSRFPRAIATRSRVESLISLILFIC